MPDAQKLSPSPVDDQPDAPLQIASSNPDAPAPDLTDPDTATKWADTRTPRKDPDERDAWSKSAGSGVISPTIHNLLQQAQSADVAQRYEFCRQLRILFENDYTTMACINARVEGACRLGVKEEVVPIEGHENNPVAIQSAERSNRAYQAVAKLTPKSELEMIMREYILFGGIYDRVWFNSFGTITDLLGLPCQTVKILVNSQLRLDDGQLIAFQQFDPYQWGSPIFQFADVNVVAVRNRLFRSDIYGTTFLLSIIKYIQDNIKTMDHIQRGRIGDIPITVQQREDAIGNGIHPTALNKAKYESIEARIKRGEDLGTHAAEWINGKGKMDRLESSGNYYTGFDNNDVKYRGSAIAAVLGRSLAMLIAPDEVNYSNAEWLNETDKEREAQLAILFSDTRSNSLRVRADFITNLAATAADNRWGMDSGRRYIESDLVKMKCSVVGEVTEARSMKRVEAANGCVSAGTMPVKEAAFVAAQAFKRDPEQWWNDLLRERPDLRKYYPEDWAKIESAMLSPQLNSKLDPKLLPAPSDQNEPEKVM